MHMYAYGLSVNVFGIFPFSICLWKMSVAWGLGSKIQSLSAFHSVPSDFTAQILFSLEASCVLAGLWAMVHSSWWADMLWKLYQYVSDMSGFTSDLTTFLATSFGNKTDYLALLVLFFERWNVNLWSFLSFWSLHIDCVQNFQKKFYKNHRLKLGVFLSTPNPTPLTSPILSNGKWVDGQ